MTAAPPQPASIATIAPCLPGATRARENLTSQQRRAIYETLLEQSTDGGLPYGALHDLAVKFRCHWRTISRVWTRGRASLRNGNDVADVASRLQGNVGRKKTRTSEEIEQAIKTVPHFARQTLRSVAHQSNIPKSTIIRHIRETKRLKARSSYVKPLLTEDNLKTRLKFAMNFVRPSASGTHIFASMHQYVHVDEKWFYLTKVKRNFYVYDDEDIALRSVKSKQFITKVMLLAAVARPRYDSSKKKFFDGKVGVWPFVEVAPAKRTSKNRPKGLP
ncbi:hypothetical protein H257_01600 [Aphanomyces astaci]|uniref:DUF7769 domain-containing protein n=1 Tax=Aphanomyces astaci TaxID=112090 RepID=W4H8S5_APHAT|nr:hypothetical protein H257_01600 [Aphanomyces astaci]ETV88327.1 hypothetical protein H257_01600 [Aphanomyces astaci]|eukprot:XP_009823190.1 hypothetical protein H257_01600 [Aphanomyces astaci]